MRQKLVSIVLPVYNGEKCLSQSIESVLSQTYKNIELIIVNDCSTDNSQQIAEEWAYKDNRVKVVINEQNQKLPESLNIGFRNASGDYFTWTSDDNYYRDTAIEEMVSFLESRQDVDLVYCDFEKIDGNSKFLSYLKVDSDPRNLIKLNTVGACFLYRKEIALKVGEYDKNKFLVEDYDYWLRIGLTGKIAALNKNLYTYRSHEASLSMTRANDVRHGTEGLLIEYYLPYLNKFPELKEDKKLKKTYYVNLRKFYFRTSNDVYYNKIMDLGFFYKFNSPFLKRKLKGIQKKTKEQQIEKDLFSIERVKKSLDWIEKYAVNNNGIAIESNQPNVIYPEVTGYYIPTLLKWGERQRARDFALYLLTIQNENGSWSEPSGKTPYTFDTGQILKGLWEFIDEDEKFKTAFLRGCDWILTQQREDGSIATPDYSWWGLPFGKRVPESIHVYCLEPLKNAKEKYGIQKYDEFIKKALKFYLAQNDLIDFESLSHFHAYIIEGLIDVGEIKRAQKAMNEVAKIQKKDGSVSAYSHVDFVCSTGLFQYAICWYKLGDKERGDKAFAYALSLQNESGGFFGSYGENANYFEKGEIAWAVKYFLDALYYGQQCSYDKIFKIFPNSVDSNDGRLLAVNELIEESKPQKILDLGCGKGRFSKELMKKHTESQFFGVDLSQKILNCTPDGLITKQGSLLNIPYADEYFDFIFCIEALEHAINIEGAISEIARVLKKGGRCIVIDKNIKKLGQLQLAHWEQWLDVENLKQIFEDKGLNTDVKLNIPYGKEDTNDDLFVGWIGEKQ